MFHRFLPLFVVSSLLFVSLSFVTNSKSWFFFRTGLHDINKMGISGEYENEPQAVFDGETITVPPERPDSSYFAQIMGETTDDNKRIEIDLSSQKLYAYDGDSLVYNFTISSGKPWWATPTGEFRTWIKLRYQRMRGGSRALGTYYDLPNVPHIMYFYNDKVPQWRGYGIHGAYWHNNFGNPMSHGCVNVKLMEAEALYNWAGVGTRVTISGSTPT